MRIVFVSILMALAILAVNARLVVYHPNSLRKKIDKINGEIPSSLANFGLVHYGHSIIGRVWYDDKNPDGCNSFEITIDGYGDPDVDPSPIVLVERGNGPFTQKVRNVEHAGGRLAIVIDNKKGEEIEDILMVDDGSGNGISIPAMLISYQHGSYIKNALEDADGNHTNPAVALMASFDMKHPDNRVEWDFWYTSSNNKAYEFLIGYHELHQKLGSKTLFTPHFSFWSCEQGEDNIKKTDCFSKGKYGAIEKEVKGFTGQEILYEDLRQKGLHDELLSSRKEDMWWEYIEKVHSHCQNRIDQDCSEKVHKMLNLDFKKTQDCVDDSFNGRDHSMAENEIFYKEAKYLKKYGPSFMPAAVINNVTYRGALDPNNFFDAIGEGFKDKPSQCNTKGTHTTIIEGISTSTLVMIILVLVLVNVGVIVGYKKYAKREMDDKIEMHINSAVSQYFALQDKSNSRTMKPLVH